MKSGTSLFLFLCLALQPVFSQREMWMSSTDENIIKRNERQSKVLFQLPLGHQLLESMQRVGDNKLLLGLKENSPQLRSSAYTVIDSKSGQITWQYTCQKGDYRIFWTSDSYIVLKREDKKKTSFIALDLNTGDLIWEKGYSSAKTAFAIESDSESLITYSSQKGVVTLSVFSLKSGASLWKTQIETTWTNPPFVLLDGRQAFVFSNTISVVNADSGKVSITLNPENIGEISPLIPSFDASHLFFIDSQNLLYSIDKQNGETQWEIQLPKAIIPTNITSQTNHLYIRGEDADSNFHLVSVSKESGDIRWDSKQSETLTSNFIESDDFLFFASPSTLYGVNSQTGKTLFTKSVTQTGRSFPISLREVNEQIIFIGELVIAGYDKNTGKLKYKHGFSPIHVNLHYNGLDSSLPKLKEDLEGLQNYENSGVTQMASNQQAYYQKMSNKNYSDYLKYRSQKQPGADYKANMARYRSGLYSNMARMQAGISMSFAILELGSALEQLLKANATQAEIRKQEYYRKTILDVYTSALSENYVFRPNLKYYATDDQYVCVSLINLETGKKKNHLLSPQYLEYGLWNLVDFEKGIIYHHGVGMDPKKYKISKSRRTTLVKFKTVETFLVAQPFSLN
ncbi:PQQ-binding-like beta-propeller repeat protein [Flagellimonas sp.]|uniref:outer membrane protein assembly factor BamB family protein n=1 Tax=Flagellimonas sp. TaxID=2058762 RepID=UPI003F4A5F96